jgi:hypothetical protein
LGGKYSVRSSEAATGRGGAQRPVLHVNEPKKDGCAQCTGAHARPKPLVVHNERKNKHLILSYLIQFWAHFTTYLFVSVDLLLVSVQSKHRNSLFRYRSETTETKVLFRIVPKLVSVPVSVVSNRNYFRRTP